MSKPRWKDGRLDLGRLGEVRVVRSPWDYADHKQPWRWCMGNEGTGYIYRTQETAQRAAERWLRVALRQASKRIGGE